MVNVKSNYVRENYAKSKFQIIHVVSHSQKYQIYNMVSYQYKYETSNGNMSVYKIHIISQKTKNAKTVVSTCQQN